MKLQEAIKEFYSQWGKESYFPFIEFELSDQKYKVELTMTGRWTDGDSVAPQTPALHIELPQLDALQSLGKDVRVDLEEFFLFYDEKEALNIVLESDLWQVNQ